MVEEERIYIVGDKYITLDDEYRIVLFVWNEGKETYKLRIYFPKIEYILIKAFLDGAKENMLLYDQALLKIARPYRRDKIGKVKKSYLYSYINKIRAKLKPVNLTIARWRNTAYTIAVEKEA